MVRMASLAVRSLSTRWMYNVVVCLSLITRGHLVHSWSFIIPVATVIRMAPIPLVLGFPVIHVDQMNNVHASNFSCKACNTCSCIPCAHASSDVAEFDHAYSTCALHEIFYFLEVLHLVDKSCTCSLYWEKHFVLKYSCFCCSVYASSS